MKTESPTINSSPKNNALGLEQDASMTLNTSPQQTASINKTLQDTPGFRMRKFNKNKRFKENYFEMRMMDTSASTCSSFESSFNSNIYSKVNQTNNKRKAASQSTKKRKKSAQSNMEVTSFVSMSNGTISNSFPIISFDSDAMVKSASLPSFALSSVIDPEFNAPSETFFHSDPSGASSSNICSHEQQQQLSIVSPPIIIENTSSLVELLLSNNSSTNISASPTAAAQQHQQETCNVVVASNSLVVDEHVVAPITTTPLKTIILGDGGVGTSSCNNSIASPSASSSLSNTTVCNHLMIHHDYQQHHQQTISNCGGQIMWGSILPLKPVCIDEICSEWEQLMSVQTPIIVSGSNTNNASLSLPVAAVETLQSNLV